MKDVDHDAFWELSSLEAHSTFANERSGRLFFEMTAQLKPTAESSDNFKTCELPDDHIITVGAEDFHCTEVLFQQSLFGKGTSGEV